MNRNVNTEHSTPNRLRNACRCSAILLMTTSLCSGQGANRLGKSLVLLRAFFYTDSVVPEAYRISSLLKPFL